MHLLTKCYKSKILLKFFYTPADTKYVISCLRSILMIKKISQPSCNISDSVEFILRGARKRRYMALMNANAINADAGIQAKFAVVK